ncbi:MAG: CSLREA domain-containing protein, partial [Acidobacteriota bacterium]
MLRIFLLGTLWIAAMPLHGQSYASEELFPPIIVNSVDDSVVAMDTACTLREAVNNVNADADTTGGDCGVASAIQFDPMIDGTPIVLSGAAQDDANLSGDLDLLRPASIVGNGPGLTIISGGGIDRVFDVPDEVAGVVFEGLEIREGNSGAEDGGGVSCRAFSCVFRDSLFAMNQTDDDGGGIA